MIIGLFFITLINSLVMGMDGYSLAWSFKITSSF